MPPPLQNVTLRTLDLALLQAGAGVKGEFENRLKGLIEEVKNSPTPIILFIDEAHTMIGAGGAAGQNDAANLLKPALARGELRTIAATTWSEYKKYFEKDPALARRFQLVKVEEPTEDVCMQMMRGIVPGAREAPQRAHSRRAVSMRRCVCRTATSPDRQLPDKAVSVLDTACARLALGQSADAAGGGGRAAPHRGSRRADARARARGRRRRGPRRAARGDRGAAREDRSASWRRSATRWEKETRTRHADPRDPRDSSRQHHAGAQTSRRTPTALRAKLDALDTTSWTRCRARRRSCASAWTRSIVGEVISGWTGIPVGKMMRDEMAHGARAREAPGRARHRPGPRAGAISRRIRTSRAGIEDPQKPKGVFMLVGPVGVGKTETALALSDLLYGGEHNMITINMSEFQESHTVSTLKGSPPGYVGYGEGGVLTEAVRRRPYSVVLLDEVEKAHPDVLELFFQVFDKGRMEDGEGPRDRFQEHRSSSSRRTPAPTRS